MTHPGDPNEGQRGDWTIAQKYRAARVCFLASVVQFTLALLALVFVPPNWVAGELLRSDLGGFPFFFCFHWWGGGFLLGIPAFRECPIRAVWISVPPVGWLLVVLVPVLGQLWGWWVLP